MTVSSGFGSEARIYLKAIDSGHPAQRECSSINSLAVPISFQPLVSLPYVAFATRSRYSGGIISSRSLLILILSLPMNKLLFPEMNMLLDLFNNHFGRHGHAARNMRSSDNPAVSIDD